MTPMLSESSPAKVLHLVIGVDGCLPGPRIRSSARGPPVGHVDADGAPVGFSPVKAVDGDLFIVTKP
ncbi:hypothetical protein [Nonomuraea sp. NPDC049607]|uniref:hypothetical protein n=1 Tax=Nonomuraea sp. NPDC049607 TaxID=3154732 RepID=UPI0034386555